jgi:hypothetical protein
VKVCRHISVRRQASFGDKLIWHQRDSVNLQLQGQLRANYLPKENHFTSDSNGNIITTLFLRVDGASFDLYAPLVRILKMFGSPGKVLLSP